jgi:hypothetical protein
LTGIILENLWFEHLKVGIWAYHLNGALLRNLRIRNTFADGINLCGGSVNNLIENCDIRNTGDDAIAIWSPREQRRAATGNTIRHNTTALPWLANNIALYGSEDTLVEKNLLFDTVVSGSGIDLASDFEPEPMRGTIRVLDNTLIRCGSESADVSGPSFGTIRISSPEPIEATLLIKGNTIIDATYSQGGDAWLSRHGTAPVAEVITEDNKVE